MNLASSLRFSSSTSSARSPCLPPRRSRTIEAAGRGSEGVPRFGASAGPALSLTHRPTLSGVSDFAGHMARKSDTPEGGSAEGALAAAAQPGAAGEPGEQGDQGERGEDREADHGDAGGDGEDVAGVVERVADRPSRRRRSPAVAPAPVSIRSETRERLARRSQARRAASAARRRGGARRAARLRPRRARASVVGAGELRRAGRRSVARESCSRSPTPTVGAVMSSVASCRERTSAIAEKAASASPSLAARDQQLEVGARPRPPRRRGSRS